MNILTELKTIMQTVDPKYGFYYNSWPSLNEIDMDNATYPAMFLIRMEVGGFSVRKAGIFTTHELMIAFSDFTNGELDSEETETVLITLRDKARAFLAAYNTSNKFEPLPETIPFHTFFEKGNAAIVGIEMTFKCIQNDYYC